ncbi:MAG: MFS transporter, partial [Rhodoferax sp.]
TLHRLHGQTVTLPLLGPLHPWQVVLIAAGALGIPLIVATLFMREPPRIHLRGRAAGDTTRKGPGFMTAFRAHPRALTAHFIGFTAMAFASYGATAWMPTLFIREYGWTPAMVGARLGLIALIAGPLGTVFGGLIADRLEKARRYDGKFLVGAIAAACTAIPAVALGLSSTVGTTYAAAAIVVFFSSFVWGVAPGALQEIVHGSVLGRVTAIYTALLNLVALGLAPPTVALLGESVAGKHGGLGVAIAIVVPIACVVAFIAFATSRAAYKSARLN